MMTTTPYESSDPALVSTADLPHTAVTPRLSYAAGRIHSRSSVHGSTVPKNTTTRRRHERALQFGPAWTASDPFPATGEAFVWEDDDYDDHRNTNAAVSVTPRTSPTATPASANVVGGRTSSSSCVPPPLRSPFPRKYTEAAQQCAATAAAEGGRIARLQSLFRSRATVRGGSAGHPPAPPPPASPAPSSGSSSSAYVGWPGTQDAQGQTLPAVASSYEDSSSTAGPAPSSSSWHKPPPRVSPTTTTTRKVQPPVVTKDDDGWPSAEEDPQQISRWTANTSASTAPEDCSSVEDEEDPHNRSFPSPGRSHSPGGGWVQRQSSGGLGQAPHQTSVAEDPPTSAADFYVAAAIADAQAAAAARFGIATAAVSRSSSRTVPSSTAVRNDAAVAAAAVPFASSATVCLRNDVSSLRQTVPLTRTKKTPPTTTGSFATAKNDRRSHNNHRVLPTVTIVPPCTTTTLVTSSSSPPKAAVSLATSRSFPADFTLWASPTAQAETSVVTHPTHWSPEAASRSSSSAYFSDRDVVATMQYMEYPVDLRYSGPVDVDDLFVECNLPKVEDESLREQAPPTSAPYPCTRDTTTTTRPTSRDAAVAAAAASHNALRWRRQQRTPSSASLSAAAQPPTEDALQLNDRFFHTPHRNFTTPTAKGYRGLLDKTKEAPSLMDNFDSDSLSSSKAPSVVSATLSNGGDKPHQRDQFRHDHSNQMRNNNGLRRTEDDTETLSDVFDGISVSKESDVFDNLSQEESQRPSPRKLSTIRQQRASYPERIAEEEGDLNVNSAHFDALPAGEGEFKLVLLGGGLSAIQTTHTDFVNRRTASDFDGNLTNSDVSSNGYVRIPGFLEMVSSGKHRDNSLQGIHGNVGVRPRTSHPLPAPNNNDAPKKRPSSHSSGSCHSGSSGSSHRSSLFSDPYQSETGLEVDGDLSEYYVHPSLMKTMVRKYRSFFDQNSTSMGFAAYEKEEDERKAFALFEMRSRVMEKDIERGLERRGGSFVVDDLVTTPYNRTAHRIRDAVIVSKAWRDGATITDVVNAALLTRRAEHSYFIKRPIFDDGTGESSTTRQRFTWEPVKWIDDTDFAQYRCPSLASRHMRGFEMFTIGDCQSILLKLTNERCMVSTQVCRCDCVIQKAIFLLTFIVSFQELRKELNVATAKQIMAEDLLKEEGDNFDGSMTEAEVTYLTAMEDVKTISKKLVSAEQSFALVRDRIQKLISRYEAMLSKIETQSFAGASSVVTYESSYYSEYDNSEYCQQEERVWARRALRAEVKAEIAAREALLAKREARIMQEEKMREIEALKKKLEDLQSEASAAPADNEKAVVTNSLALRRNNGSPIPPQSAGRMSKEKLDGVKQRFRDRMAAKKEQSVTPPGRAPLYPSPQQRITPSPQALAERELIRSAGEELYQLMVFYERSLEAVDHSRG